LSLDPLADQSEAPYTYAGGDPTYETDPNGLLASCANPGLRAGQGIGAATLLAAYTTASTWPGVLNPPISWPGARINSKLVLGAILAAIGSATGGASEKEDLYRVRIQAQGPDIPESQDGGAPSEIFNQTTPVTMQQGLDALVALASKLTSKQAEVRAPLFEKAAEFIKEAGAAGGVEPFPSKSFTLPRSGGIRVDISVFAGRNFVNPMVE
jgi:hypothetical protein